MFITEYPYQMVLLNTKQNFKDCVWEHVIWDCIYTPKHLNSIRIAEDSLLQVLDFDF